jgi:hypothetical protein
MDHETYEMGRELKQEVRSIRSSLSEIHGVLYAANGFLLLIAILLALILWRAW